jgi:hypothetical protein
MQDGIIFIWIDKVMTKIFGANWRTSLWGLMAVLPQIAKPIQDYLKLQEVSDKTLNIVSIVAAIIFALNSKDKQVSGIK